MSLNSMFGLFFPKETDEKDIAERNREYVQKEPVTRTVVNTMVVVPDAKYMPETTKALQLVLEQDRLYRKQLTNQRELLLLKEYLKHPSRNDFAEVLEREKELETSLRFNDGLVLSVPPDHIEKVKNNATIEYHETIKAYDNIKEEIAKINQQIEKLQHKASALKDEAIEIKRYINMNEVFTDFLNNMDKEEDWGTYETGYGIGSYNLTNKLREDLSRFNGLLECLTADNKPYYNEQLLEYDTTNNQGTLGGITPSSTIKKGKTDAR